ncbi:MAG: replication-associated recombination protein A [Alphaproteobacteria bacterium]
MPDKKHKDGAADMFCGTPQTPLAERLRPQTLDDVIGQDHLLGAQGVLGAMIASNRLSPLILWGAPGCGKTTIARLLSAHFDLEYVALSAIFSGVADLKKCFENARIRHAQGRSTLLFIDEIHRFNKAQQDAFLPVVEDGTVILVGATTENPSFELNNALISRCQVLVLKRLDETALDHLLCRAESLMERALPLDPDARSMLLTMADGDGRAILSMADLIFNLVGEAEKSDFMSSDQLLDFLQKRKPLYDKSDDHHYNMISALHKSLRGSDVDAALYYYSRMIDGGDEPLYIARRLMRFAYEDIGMADPNAALQAEAATRCYERLGSPEGEIALAHLVIYLATAPKSNGVYRAQKAALKAAKAHGSLSPPPHILNAPTKLMKQIGYGKDYQYDHDHTNSFSGQNYFPDGLPRMKLYDPIGWGFEKEVKKRLEYWQNLREKK